MLSLLILSTVNKIYIFLNRILAILCLITLVSFSTVLYKHIKSVISDNKAIKTIKKLPKKQWTVNVTHKSDKTVIFIILDEYASPAVFKKVNINKTNPDLADYLDSTGWITRKQSYSAETGTIYSISSIFNNNLSKDGNYESSNYATYTNWVEVSEYLKKAPVVRNLTAKNVTFKNHSFFEIADSKDFIYLYGYPHNFSDLFFISSLYPFIKEKAKKLKLGDSKLNDHTSSEYNQEVYNLIISTLNQPGTPKQFIYLHLLMPHSPILFGDEIALKGYAINNYYKYWLFTNNKIINALKQSKHLNDYRIIISGDHGYRDDKRIDAHQTLTAFYGFDQADVDQVRSVQDIGTLIEGSFK